MRERAVDKAVTAFVSDERPACEHVAEFETKVGHILRWTGTPAAPRTPSDARRAATPQAGR